MILLLDNSSSNGFHIAYEIIWAESEDNDVAIGQHLSYSAIIVIKIPADDIFPHSDDGLFEVPVDAVWSMDQIPVVTVSLLLVAHLYYDFTDKIAIECRGQRNSIEGRAAAP